MRGKGREVAGAHSRGAKVCTLMRKADAHLTMRGLVVLFKMTCREMLSILLSRCDKVGEWVDKNRHAHGPRLRA